MKFHYFLYGQHILSEILLGDLPQKSGRSRTPIMIRKCPPSNDGKPKWFHTICDLNGKPFSSFAKIHDRLLVRLHPFADFEISKKGTDIGFSPKPGTDPKDIQSLILSHILPLAMNQKGFEVLHASAVCIHGRTIAFMGEQGKGKSTLAAAFANDSRELVNLVTDDALAVFCKKGHFFVIPSYPEIRLNNTAFMKLYHNQPPKKVRRALFKKAAQLNQCFSTKTHPLVSIFFIKHGKKSPHSQIKIRNLSQKKALPMMLKNSFRLDLFDRKRMIREMNLLTTLLDTVPVRELIFPRGFKFLPQVFEAVSRMLLT